MAKDSDLPDESTPLLVGAPTDSSSSTQAGSESSTIAAADAACQDRPDGQTDEQDVLEDADDVDDEQTVLVREPDTRVIITLCTVYVGIFVGAADASVIATLSAPIASDFKSLSLLSWLAASYLVASAACQPVSGRVTDVVGRGPGLIFSNVLFALGNLMCALAGSAGTMLAGRVIAGIGGGGLMSISTFLASDLVPLRQRGVWQGFGNIAYSAGSMLGGVLGGMAEHVWEDRWYGGWRLAFLVQVPIALVSAVLVSILVRVPPHKADEAEGNASALRRIDFTGAGLLVSFLVLLLLGLNAGGNIVPWSHPLVLVSLPLAAAGFVAFVFWEANVPHHPILPVRLIVRRTVLAACTSNLVCTATMMIVIFYLPLYLQVRGYSAAQAGQRLFFSPLGASVSSIGSGLIMKRTGRYMRLAVVSLLVFCASPSLAYFGGLASLTSPAWVPFATFFCVGSGYGAMLTVTLLACISAVSQARQAVITSATYACRSVGGTLGLTVASAVYQNILRARLWDRFGDLPGAAEQIKRICDDLSELRRLPLGWEDGVMQSFMDAFRGVWLTGLLLAVIGLVSVSLMKQHTLHSTLDRQ